MSPKSRIKINSDAIEQLRQEVADSVQAKGVEVSCPHCGAKTIARGNAATCPECKHDFEVVFKF